MPWVLASHTPEKLAAMLTHNSKPFYLERGMDVGKTRQQVKIPLAYVYHILQRTLELPDGLMDSFFANECHESYLS